MEYEKSTPYTKKKNEKEKKKGKSCDIHRTFEEKEKLHKCECSSRTNKEPPDHNACMYALYISKNKPQIVEVDGRQTKRSTVLVPLCLRLSVHL